MSETFLEEFGERLKYLRKNRDLTQREVAAILNCSYNMISGYELGKRSPDLLTLVKLCDFYDVSADYLLGRLSQSKIKLK